MELLSLGNQLSLWGYSKRARGVTFLTSKIPIPAIPAGPNCDIE
jgi:hypothetical protein